MKARELKNILLAKRLKLVTTEDKLVFISPTGVVLKTVRYDEVRNPKPDFKKCIGLIPLPKYANPLKPDEITEGGYISAAERLRLFGCRSCPDRELCIRLKELSIWDMIGQPSSK